MADAKLDTLANCELVIGRYPRFLYNAIGGGARGEASATDHGSTKLRFPTDQIAIPDLNWRTTRFLGLPLPPGLTISIHPQTLAGHVIASSGQVELQFRSRFRFRMGASQAIGIRAPDLVVDTLLTTESVESNRHRVHGQRLDRNHRAVLVGTALIVPTGAAWLDRFLGLPDEALAVLKCRVQL